MELIIELGKILAVHIQSHIISTTAFLAFIVVKSVDLIPDLIKFIKSNV